MRAAFTALIPAIALAACTTASARGAGTLALRRDGSIAAHARAESAERTRPAGRPRVAIEAALVGIGRDTIDVDVSLSSDDGEHASATSWFIDLVDDAHHRESEPVIVRESRAHDTPVRYARTCPGNDHHLARLPGGDLLEVAPGDPNHPCRYDEHYYTRASRLRFHRGALLSPGARTLSLYLEDATVHLALRWSIAREP